MLFTDIMLYLNELNQLRWLKLNSKCIRRDTALQPDYTKRRRRPEPEYEPIKTVRELHLYVQEDVLREESAPRFRNYGVLAAAFPQLEVFHIVSVIAIGDNVHRHVRNNFPAQVELRTTKVSPMNFHLIDLR